MRRGDPADLRLCLAVWRCHRTGPSRGKLSISGSMVLGIGNTNRNEGTMPSPSPYPDSYSFSVTMPIHIDDHYQALCISIDYLASTVKTGTPTHPRRKTPLTHSNEHAMSAMQYFLNVC